MLRPSFIPTWLLRLAAALLMVGAAMQAARAADEFLDPDIAFKLSARALDERRVEVNFEISPGYYLYRERFAFSASGATLGAPEFPPGQVKFDETFQKNVETFHNGVRIVIPVQQAGPTFRLAVTNQGCADKGLCYPPQQRAVEVSLTGFGGKGTTQLLGDADTSAAPPDAGAATTTATAATPAATPAARTDAAPASDDAAGLAAALHGGHLWTIVGVFFAAGVLLSLTPCVLPMLPILSSIIVGQSGRGGDAGAASRARGFSLALSYSLGMALVYTALGVAAGLAGEGLAAALQNPWVLGLFAAGLVALSLSMFGVYELQLPSALSGRLTNASQRLPGGRVVGVFAMGGVSALIVSPCVAAPLAGALVYLSQTRDVLLGGSALFALACGMSVPLLLVGASAGAVLPRAGAWMNEVKRFFGLLLLAVALWTVDPVLPVALTLALWGALALAVAVCIVSGGRRHTWAKSLPRRALAALFAAVGLLQLVGAASGGSDPLQPLAHLTTHGDTSPAPSFQRVASVAELDAALRSAGRPVMLDFYADWCVSCKEMERFTFTDPDIKKRLQGALLLKADVTANSADDRALLKRFQLFGPPGTIFFDAEGREVSKARLVGFQNSRRFGSTLEVAGL